MKIQSKQHALKPSWLKKRLPSGPDFENVKVLINKSQLHTVCQEAKCPNIWECFSKHTATFLILGERCTRNCRFCAVAHGPLKPPDPEEPLRVAKAAQAMSLQYVVVTSVTRDDLPDGGAGLFAHTIREIRNRMTHTKVEVLIPDFQGNAQALKTVLKEHPDVLNHNIETVPRLYSTVRPEAIYARSLELLKRVHIFNATIPTKSGLMLGLGETSDEIQRTLQDLLDAGCRILTLGQYLQPTHKHLPVARFVTPNEFDHWQKIAYDLGFSEVASGPFVRSSYQAHELFQSLKL
jgi:lipoic acid synthetase